MLPEIGATELMVIAAVALIVVGPKDLPILLRKLGQWVAKARGMAAEFRASFDEMARQSELDELRREVAAMRSGQYLAPLHQAVDLGPDPSVNQVFSDIEASLAAGEVSLAPPMSGQFAQPETAPEPPASPKRKRAPAKPKAAADGEAAPAAPAAPKPRAPRRKKTETPS